MTEFSHWENQVENVISQIIKDLTNEKKIIL